MLLLSQIFSLLGACYSLLLLLLMLKLLLDLLLLLNKLISKSGRFILTDIAIINNPILCPLAALSEELSSFNKTLSVS